MIEPILTSQYMESYQNKTNFYGFEILTNQLGFYFDYFSFKLFATDWLNGSQSQYCKIMVWQIHWVGTSVIFFEWLLYDIWLYENHFNLSAFFFGVAHLASFILFLFQCTFSTYIHPVYAGVRTYDLLDFAITTRPRLLKDVSQLIE